MPMIAPMHQPHETRLAMAMPPSTITRMMAIGVSHARMFVSRAVAPVRNGDAWANAGCGSASDSTAATPSAMVGAMVSETRGLTIRAIGCNMSPLLATSAIDSSGARHKPLRVFGAPGCALFAFRLAGRAKAKALHDEVISVVSLAILIRPLVRPYLSIDDELIALARRARDRLAQWAERGEPDAGGDLT